MLTNVDLWIKLDYLGEPPISEPVLLASPFWDYPVQGTLNYRGDSNDYQTATVYGNSGEVIVTHYQLLPSLPKA